MVNRRLLLIFGVSLMALMITAGSMFSLLAPSGDLANRPTVISETTRSDASIKFINEIGQAISQTNSPTVRVQLMSSWSASSSAIPSPTPQAIAATFQVSAGVDDVNEDQAIFNTFDADSPTFWIGNGVSKNNSFTGIRFAQVAIPKEAAITDAYLEVYNTTSQRVSVRVEVAAEKNSDSVPFTRSNPPSGRTLTSARVSHDTDISWNGRSWRKISSLASLIQEVIDEKNWQSGNSLSLVIKGVGNINGRKFVRSFDGDSEKAPKLTIVYTIPQPYTTQVVVSEDPLFEDNLVEFSYISHPLVVDYTFIDATSGVKTLYARFHSSEGEVVEASGTIELILPSPTPTPFPTPSPAGSIMVGLAFPDSSRVCSYPIVWLSADSTSLLDKAASCGTQVIIQMYQNTSEILQDDGSGIDMAKFEQKMKDQKGKIDMYVDDGTIVGHFIIDEPHDCTNDWGGDCPETSEVEEAARIAKNYWPTLKTIVNTVPRYADDVAWSDVDVINFQYAYHKGDLESFKNDSSDIYTQGKAREISWSIQAAAGGCGEFSECSMTPAQVSEVGKAMCDTGQGSSLTFYRYNRDIMTSEMEQTIADLASYCK